jgi:sterol 3beta-glucosyltransferase
VRITVLALGSRGDVQPFLAIAYHLHRAGFKVRMAANEDFKILIRSYGLDYFSLGSNTQKMINTPEGQEMIGSGKFIAGIRYFRKHALRQMEEVQHASWQACQETDLLIYSALQLWGPSIADKLGIPSYPVFLIPFYPTRELPIPQGRIPDIPALNPLLYRALVQAIWRIIYRSPINAFRTNTLELSPLPAGYQNVLGNRKDPILFAYSAHVLPLPADWPPQARITGYCFLPPPPDWEPPADLLGFLESGPAPIYIGFGSMSDREAARKTEIVLTALAQTGQRAILHRGWGGLQANALTTNVFMVDSIPHEWLFGKVSMAIHHGGAGTTAAGLRAGIPSLVIPHFGDQFFWANRVHKLGAGPRPIPLKKLSAKRLSEAILSILKDAPLRERAAALGKKIRAEDGLGTLQSMVKL